MPDDGPSCPACGYDLATLVRGRDLITCPECGSNCDRFSRREPPPRTLLRLLALGSLPTTLALGLMVGLLGAAATYGLLVLFALALFPLLMVVLLAGLIWPFPVAAYVLREGEDREVLLGGILLVGCNVLQIVLAALLLL